MVRGLEDRNYVAVGRIERKIDIVETVKIVVKLLVELKHNFLGILGISGDIAYAHTYNCSAVILDVAHLDDGDVEVAIESVAEFLSKL